MTKPPAASTTQLQQDRRLLQRIDDHATGLSPREATMLESFLVWTESGKPLTEKQRKVAEDIDEHRVR